MVITNRTSGMDLPEERIKTGFAAIIKAEIPAILELRNRTLAKRKVSPTVAAPASKKKILEPNSLTPKSLNPAKTAQ